MNYQEIIAVNQSLLKKIAKGPYYYDGESNADHFVLGTLTEAMYNKDAYNYIVMDFPSKTTNLGKLLNAVWDMTKFQGSWTTVEQRQSIYNSLNIKSPKFETIDLDVIEFFNPFINIDISNTIVVSADIMSKAVNMVEKLQNDRFVNQLFSVDGEVVNSFVIEWNHQEPCIYNDSVIKMKAEIDKLIIDYTHKTIQVVDLKTMGDLNYNFSSSFWKYRYDVQAAFYKYGVDCIINNQFPGFTQLNPIFIAVDPYSPHPLIYQTSNDTLKVGEHGKTTPYGEYMPGWRHLLDLYRFYEVHGYEYPKEVQINGVLPI